MREGYIREEGFWLFTPPGDLSRTYRASGVFLYDGTMHKDSASWRPSQVRFGKKKETSGGWPFRMHG